MRNRILRLLRRIKDDKDKIWQVPGEGSKTGPRNTLEVRTAEDEERSMVFAAAVKEAIRTFVNRHPGEDDEDYDAYAHIIELRTENELLASLLPTPEQAAMLLGRPLKQYTSVRGEVLYNQARAKLKRLAEGE